MMNPAIVIGKGGAGNRADGRGQRCVVVYLRVRCSREGVIVGFILHALLTHKKLYLNMV